MSSYPTDDSVHPTTPIFDETVEATAVSVTDEADTGTGSRTDQAKEQAKQTAGQATQTAKETAGVAKEQAGEVAGTAKDATARVAGTTKDEATRVAKDALGQARELYGQATSELSSQASQQQTRAASTLRTLGEDLHGMGGNQDGLAAELVQNLSQRASRVASWLEEREPGDVLDEVKQFAARRPGLFIALAATAGVVGARLTKALVAEAKDDAADTTRSGLVGDTGTAGYPSTTGYGTGTVGGAGYGTPAGTGSTYVGGAEEAVFVEPPLGGSGTTGGLR